MAAQQAQNNMQVQQQHQQYSQNGPSQQQMDYMNSARNMMAFNQFQQQQQQHQMNRQQPPPIMQAPPQMYQPSLFMQQNQNYQQQQQMQPHQQSIQQDYLNQSNKYWSQKPQNQVSEEMKDPSEFDDKIEEFDQDFMHNNPGIVQTQKYFQQNYELVQEMNHISGEVIVPPFEHRDEHQWRNMHINLSNNNCYHNKKFGLNQNKRGRIIDSDFQKLQNSIRNQYSQRNEEFLNKKFMQLPQVLVQKHMQQKAKLEQQFVHQQYQNQGKILQVLNSLDEKINGIGQKSILIQNQLNNLQDPQGVNKFGNPSGSFRQSNLMVSENSSLQQQQMIQQDALARIRDQVKEELKEELKNQIRQELIDQMPKESQDALKKKGFSSFQPQNPAQNQSSPGSNNRMDIIGSKEQANNSLNEYKFGMINNNKNSEKSGKEPSFGEVQSKGSKNSNFVDSDHLESERLRKSYDEYGKMISSRNQQLNYKQQKVQPINEDVDQDRDNDLEFKKMPPPMSVKHNRSSSLACNDNQQDILSKQLDQIKQAERRKASAKRNNSIHLGNVLMRENRVGTEGDNDHIRQFNIGNNYYDGSFENNPENQSFDFLQIQMEDQRLKMLNEILQIVQGDGNDDIDEQNLNNKLKLICKSMSDLNIDYSVSRILELSVTEKKVLRKLIKNYQEILMHQSKYVNVEHLDNELKSDVDAYYDDEEENDEDDNGDTSSEDHQQASSSEDDRQQKYHAEKKKSKQNEEQDESDNDVQYENYKPKIEPKAIKINDKRRGSIVSIQSRQVSKKKEKDKQKKISKKQFESDSDEDEDNFESISHEMSASSEEEQKQQLKEMVRSPSLAEIKRRSSYQSIDSRVKKQAAQKFDPKLLKIRDDGSMRGSVRSKSSKRSNKKFLQDMVSERSGNRRQLSLYRRDKLQGLELDYHQYLQEQQGIFIIRCQMMNIELSKIREKYDLEKMMIEFKNFKKLQKEIKQDEVYRGLQTVIIDIENTFVTLIEVKNKEELDQIKEYENFHNDYIIIKKNVSKKSKKDKKASKQELDDEPEACCDFKGSDRCICDLMVYLVRPYTYEILRAIQPFFEIVVFSKLHHKILEHIIDHIESILNKPIKEFLEKYQKSMNKSSFQRMKKLPDVKIYFQFIIHQKQYIHIKEYDKHIENLLVLTKNRPKDNLIFISSNPFRIVTAIKYGFLTIPVIQFESFYRDDYQLSLVEHYILKIRHLKDMKKRLRQDFKCLVQKIDNQPCKVPNYIKNIQNKSKQFDAQSQGSFGGRKLKQKVMEIKENKKSPRDESPPKMAPTKKVDPALLQSQKPQTMNQPNKQQFKPRKSSFGNISFGDGTGKHGKRQPQSDSEDLEDYDEEEVENKVRELEQEIKSGVIANKDPPKKKLLFTKIEESNIEEKEDSEPMEARKQMSFRQDQNQESKNPQEQAPYEKSGSQPDLMQYNFQIASQGNSGLPNPFQSLYRPGLEPADRQLSANDIRKAMSNDLNLNDVKKRMNESVSYSQGEIDNYNDGDQSGGELVNNDDKAKKAVSMTVNTKLIPKKQMKRSVNVEAGLNKSSSSKTSTDQSISVHKSQDSLQSPVAGSEDQMISSSVAGSRKSHSISQNSSSDHNPKIVHGKVIYDANMVILEESKDASMISALSQSKNIGDYKQKQKGSNNINSSMDSEARSYTKKSSKMDSELIDDIYAEIDYEQQNAQMLKINEEIENSEDIDKI